MLVDLLEQSLILLEVPSMCMETYDAHEDNLVVGQVGHRLDILNVTVQVRTCISDDISGIYRYIHVYTMIYVYIPVKT